MAENIPWFKEWFNSPYYHKLYFKRDEEEAAAFINRLVSHLNPPSNSKMLDMACGRGRHSIQLASKGFDVSGIDLSEDSILEAKKSESDNLHFFVHDMRLPFWINYFNYAFNFFTSFGYFNTRRENDNAIRTISQSLKPGGTFVIDYINVHYAENNLIHKSEKTIDDVNYYITKWFDEDHFYKKIIVEDDSLEEPITHQEKVAKFTLGDFTEMFSYQELQVKQVFGNYKFEDYHLVNSPRLIIIAEKIKQQK
ncbi:MAG: class I SAM-dependent methyltransferase [Ginsengibacter sp.]